MSQEPAAAETQVWIWTLSPAAAVVTSPVRRSRTAPWRSGTTQPKQMPIRQPEGISTPAASPASSRVWEPSAADDGAGLGEGDGAAVAGGDDGRTEPLGVQPVGDAVGVPTLFEGIEHPGRAAGPRLALGEVVDQIVEARDVEHAVGVGVLLHQPDSALAGQHAQFAAEDDVVGGGRGVHDDDVGVRSPRAAMLRSIPITGVMPLPAVRNRILAGGWSPRVNSPAAWSSWTTVPTVARRTRWLLTLPSGMAFTVIAMQPSRRWVFEVSE